MSKHHEPSELRVLEHLRGEHDHLKHPKFGCHWCLETKGVAKTIARKALDAE